MAVEKLPKNRDELRMYVKIKTAQFLINGGEIKEERVTSDMYLQFMELDEKVKFIKKKRKIINE